MKLSTLMTSAVMALALSAGAAMAQTTPSTTAPTNAPMTKTTKTVKKVKVTKPAPVRSANSLACSADADAKSLHGKARTKFRKSCMAEKAKMDKMGTKKM